MNYLIIGGSRRYDWFAIIIVAVAVLMMIVCVSFLGKLFDFVHSRNLYLCQFYNPLIILLSLPMVFVAAKSTLRSEVINNISSFSLLIYLAHGNYFWQAYGKYAVLDIFGDNGITKIAATLILFILVVVTTSVVASVYQRTLGRITYKVSIWGEKTIEKIIGANNSE